MTDNTPAKTKSLGFWTCTALIIGNMIGSGFFIAPAALAPYGSVAIIGWGLMAMAAVCLGILFVKKDKLSRVLNINAYIPIGAIAFVFSVATIYGSGPTAGMWSLLLLMCAVPVWLIIEKETQDSNNE